MKKWFSLLVLFFYLAGATAQTVFWSDTFEDTGAPSSGVRTPEVEMGSGGPPYVDYFIRATNADINLSFGSYSSVEGAKFWAGEDHDNIDGVDGAPPDPELQIDWTGINISGKTNLQFIGRFAANPNLVWDHNNPTTDYVIVESSIDGGPWNLVIAFYPTFNMTPGSLAEDTDGNTLGDGTTLNAGFQEFTKNISGSGNTMALRIRAFSDLGSNEEWAVDHFRLAAGTPLPVELTRFEAGWEESAGAAELTWETGSEHNNLGFIIERSLHYGPWTEIGFVAGAGDSQRSRTYRFIDAECLAGELNYYRLRQTDLDGAVAYSDIRSVKAPESSPTVGIYPNPAREKLFFTRPLNGPFEVIDPAGRVCRKGEFREAPSLDLAGLHPGIYFLSVRSAASGVRECLFVFQLR
ncbi:MAG TPA: T9SS type A sorting domain-containing protein [Flavilitoribacter sp.]|nr:T9SS type A sorting domain-containing protein [Flavilitoribacter sp.]HMQ87099.1 T9SS type A sorting domain-containing protein [Flavilitoribacter sp.]